MSNQHFDKEFDRVVIVEGGYSNNKDDRGGATKFGITEAVARANGYDGPMADLTMDWARHIYKGQYWDTLRLDSVSAISPEIAGEMFDTGINMGISIAGKFLQRGLNVSNEKGGLYSNMTVDGQIGPVSVASLAGYIRKRGAKGVGVMMKMLNCQQGNRYIEIAEGREDNETFIFGWFANRINL